jgi:hypothetical protein
MPKKFNTLKDIPLNDIKKEISIIVKRPNSATLPITKEYKEYKEYNELPTQKTRPNTTEITTKKRNKN